MIWDDWRDRYATTSYEDQLTFYASVSAAHPDQHFYNLPAIEAFFEDHDAQRVFELGGWRGELAADIIPKCQWLTVWDNYEISSWAVERPVAPVPYRGIVPQEWIWDHPPFTGYDTAVLAHVVEHMLVDEFRRLLDKLPDVKNLFIQSPLEAGPMDWTGYAGTHIIEVGWDDLVRLVNKAGYSTVEANIDGPMNDRYAVFHR